MTTLRTECDHGRALTHPELERKRNRRCDYCGMVPEISNEYRTDQVRFDQRNSIWKLSITSKVAAMRIFITRNLL